MPCPLLRANGSATANDTAVCCVTPAFTAGANPAALNLTLSVPEVGSALLALALTLALALNLALPRRSTRTSCACTAWSSTTLPA